MNAVCRVVPSNLTSFVHLKVLETPHHHQYYIQDTFMSFAIKKNPCLKDFTLSIAT